MKYSILEVSLGLIVTLVFTLFVTYVISSGFINTKSKSQYYLMTYPVINSIIFVTRLRLELKKAKSIQKQFTGIAHTTLVKE